MTFCENCGERLDNSEDNICEECEEELWEEENGED